jgi:hypothetical protein
MARKKRPVGADGQPLDTAFLRSVGGEQLALMRQAWSTPTGHTSGGETFIWNFGWLPEEIRTEQQHEAHEAAVGLMPRFLITGTPTADGEDGANLTATWKHADVVTANGSEFTGTHQLTGSCFPAGTPVRMADGSEKPVEAVRVGDEVITHTGLGRAVVETMSRPFTGDMVTLHVAGFAFPLTMTADHRVAVMPSAHDWRWHPGEIEWRRADEVAEGDRVLIGWDRREERPQSIDVAVLLGERCVVLDDLMGRGEAPVSNVGMAQWIVRRSGIDWRGKVKLVRGRSENALNRHVPVCPSLARLIGLYLAEGGCHNGRVVFSFDGRDEEPLAAEVLALVRGLFGVEGELVRQQSRESSLKVRFNNEALAAVFKALVPGDVYTKRVPGLLFNADGETKAALVQGWMHGDGYAAFRAKGKRQARMQGVTASPGLARDVATLALSCGMRVSVSRRKARKQSRAAYDVFLSGPRGLAMFPALQAETVAAGVRTSDTDTNRTRFGYARAVRKVETHPVVSLAVYDFEVEEDHSFLAGGLVVHNCVGAGGGNMWATLAFYESIVAGEAELAKVPFWLLPYGRSRFYCGMKTPGEGSLGSCFARAAVEDGTLEYDRYGLPQPTSRDDGWIWGRNVEMSWSDGDARQSLDALEHSRKHLIKTAAQCRSASDVWQALVNGYPVTCASMYAHNGGRVQGEGKDAVLLASRSGSWAHQMSILACRKHPQFGNLFWLHNQWGLRAHGICPTGMPPGGVWIKASDVDWICRDEVYAFSQYNGFPAPSKPLDWLI